MVWSGLETYDADNGRSLECDLKVVRKIDGAFFILGAGDSWTTELLWLHAHGDKDLNDHARDVIEAVNGDWLDDELWNQPAAPKQLGEPLASRN